MLIDVVGFSLSFISYWQAGIFLPLQSSEGDVLAEEVRALCPPAGSFSLLTQCEA